MVRKGKLVIRCLSIETKYCSNYAYIFYSYNIRIMKNIVSSVFERIQKGDTLTSLTLFILLVCIFYFYNVYFRKLVEGFARYGPWETKYIGSSGSRTKNVGLDKDYMVFDNRPQNKQQSNWKDRFSTRVSGRTLSVTRQDYNGGWGQGLKLRGRVDRVAAIRARNAKRAKEFAKKQKDRVKNLAKGKSKKATKKINIPKININKFQTAAENINVGNSSSREKSITLNKKFIVVYPKPVNAQQSNWGDRFSTRLTDGGKRLIVKRLDANKGWGQPLVLKGLYKKEVKQSVRQIAPKANCSAAEKKARDAEAKRKSEERKAKAAEAKRKAEEAKRKKLEIELAKAIRERDAARLAAGKGAKDIEKYKRDAATAESERKRREADRLRREAEAKKREDEKRAAQAEQRAALLQSERDKAMAAEKLSEQQRERFNAERKRLLELQKRNENASLSLREKLAKEREARLSAEESLFGAREQIDITRNREVRRCALATERLEQRRKSQIAEIRRNQQLKEAARRRKLEEERKEKLRLDALRREKLKEMAEEREKRLKLLQMKLIREAHEKREQNRLRQVQFNKKLMDNREPAPSTSLQSGPAPVVGPNGTSVSITGKRMGPSSEMMNRISQYGVDQTNVGLKNSQEGGEETVIAGETTIGGFVYPGQPKMFGHLSNK